MLFVNGVKSIYSQTFFKSGKDDLGLGGDEGSLATGNAGARAGCCIIKEVTHFRN